MARIAVSLSDELLASMDEYAKKNFMTRSGFISMCCNQFLQSVEMQRTLSSVSDCLERLADSAGTGVLDDAALQAFQEFKSLSQLFSRGQLSK